jgi:GxxExxY protein
MEEGVDYSAYPERELTQAVIGAAFEVHKQLGPGFLEKVYENALLFELRSRGITVVSQAEIPVSYKGHSVGVYVADLLVENRLIVEIKATAAIDSSHQAQLINYLKATGLKVGLLLNFGSRSLVIKRMVF